MSQENKEYKDFETHILDFDSILNDAVKEPELYTELLNSSRGLIKLLLKEMPIIKREAEQEYIDLLKRSIIRMRQIFKEKVLVVCGYMIGVLYHLQAYRDVISIVQSYFPQKVNYSEFTKIEDAGVLGYYYGLTKIKIGDYTDAANALDKAYIVCKEEKRNELLMYLVPLKLRIGQYPSKLMMNKYGTPFLRELCDYVSRGDVAKYEQLILKNGLELFRIGMYEVIQSLRLIVYRNLLEKIVMIKKQYKFNIDILVVVINSMIEDDHEKVDSASVMNVLMNMICSGILVGNLVISFNAVTMAPQNALKYYSDN